MQNLFEVDCRTAIRNDMSVRSQLDLHQRLGPWLTDTTMTSLTRQSRCQYAGHPNLPHAQCNILNVEATLGTTKPDRNQGDVTCFSDGRLEASAIFGTHLTT